MKLSNLIILCLFTISANSQNDQIPNESLETNGSYYFTKAILTVYNSNTQKEVFTQVFNDTVSLKKLIDLPFPSLPIFLSAEIESGILRECKLWNNNKDYIVENNEMLLTPAKEINFSPNDSLRINVKRSDIFSDHYQLSPLYTLKIKDHTATFTFRKYYGNTLYDFPLEGELTVILDKDKSIK